MRKTRHRPFLFALAALALATATLGCSPVPYDTSNPANDTTLAESTQQSGESGERKAGVHLSIRTEDQLMANAGMNLAAWDKDVDKARQEGQQSSISADAIRQADKGAVVLAENDRVYYIGASSLFGRVTNSFEAYRLAYELVEALGGNSNTYLCLASLLTQNETAVYSFQQVSDGAAVLGGSLKIAVDKSGNVTGVFANIDANASHEQRLVTKEEAEAIAAEHLEDTTGKVDPELTDRRFMLLVTMEEALDVEVEGEPVPDDLVWIVYSTSAQGAEYPYVAHYVKADGTYLRSLPIKEPGDNDSLCGFRKQDVFSGMKADSYTGEIEGTDGTKRSVTIPVMRNEQDGCWYLGDVEHRVVVADFSEAAYGKDHAIIPIKSETKTNWDTEDIYALYNYLRAREFYANMGWNGPDGQDTDEVILKGIAYKDGTVYPNACSVGLVEGWQMFAYSPYDSFGEPLRLTWGLDVMAHEYTHTFTGTVMGQNLYENDLGAINEAMSDIMGNLVEYTYEDSKDTTWALGENTGNAIRNMVEPELYGQPSYVWAMYYGPKTSEPNTANDRGGVHSNSSLLNLIAAKLCTEHGMTYADAASLWTAVAMGMTPMADYPQMSALLTWALEQTGLKGAYGEALDQLVEQTRIEHTDIPSTLAKGQKLVELALPNTEAFQNKSWDLVCFQLDTDQLAELTGEAVGIVMKTLEDPDGMEKLSNSIDHLMGGMQLDESSTEAPTLVVENKGDEQDPLSQIFEQLTASAQDRKVVKQLISWEEEDTGVIPIIVDDDDPTLYMLMNISEGGKDINNVVVKIGSHWYDFGSLMQEGISEEELDKRMTEAMDTMLGDLLQGFGQDSTAKTETGIEQLPTAGLENVQLVA